MHGAMLLRILAHLLGGWKMSSRALWAVGTAVSFVPVGNIPFDDYRDFIGRMFTVQDMKADLANGVLPPGLVIADDAGTIALVRGRYGAPQSLYRFDVRFLEV